MAGCAGHVRCQARVRGVRVPAWPGTWLLGGDGGGGVVVGGGGGGVRVRRYGLRG